MAGMFSNALRSFTSNISSNYKVSDKPSSFAGPWKIFDAKHKSSGKVVSIFVLDKRTLESHSGGNSGFGSRSGGGSLKRAQEEVVERLRREASSLARLRHPSILELVEPVEDTRSGGLQFATEPVTGSLSSLLVNERDAIDELDIQKGLLQLGKGLEFLHESAGLVHANFTPEAVVINAKSDWKITGLGFSGKAANTSVATSAPEIMLSEILNSDSRLPRSVQLNLNFTSPDFVMDGNVNPSADMFSLGLMIVALYNDGKSPLDAHSSVSSYKRIFSSSSTVPTASNNFLSKAKLGRPLSDVLSRLITRRPAQRLDAKEFQQAEYFDNILVSTIRFLESLPAKTQNEKSQFLRGLPRIMPQFSSKVLEKKVLPALLEEMKDRELISLILQNVFKMIKDLPSAKKTFPEKVIPKLREVFISTPTGKGPAPERDSAKEAGLMVLLEHMQLIADNTTGKEFKDDVLPIINFALDSPTHSLVDAALQTLPVILATLDFSTIKNEVFPVIAAVFSKTSSLGIKIRGLEALKALCGGGTETDESGDGLTGFAENKKPKTNSGILDKYTIQEKVVPLLKAIKTKEPAVMMAALDVFKEIGKIADTDFLATEVLPVLWNFSLGPLLNLQQFQAFMTLIRSLSTRIEQEHTRKLQELSSSNTPVASRNDLMSFGGLSSRTNGVDESNGDTFDFEALVLGNKKPSSPAPNAFDPWGGNSESTAMASQPQPQRNNTTAAPTFSWSTPVQETKRPPAPSINTAGTLGGFGVLQPTSASSSTSGFSQPLQPSKPSLQPQSTMNSTTKTVDWSTATNTNAWSASPISTGTNTWSKSNTTTSTPTNPWTVSPSINPPPSNLWATSTTTTPQYKPDNPPRPNNAPLNPSSFSISPPPTSSTSAFSSFGITPPPLSNTQNKNTNSFGSIGGTGGSIQSTPQTNSNPKSGLEKYESLL